MFSGAANLASINKLKLLDNSQTYNKYFNMLPTVNVAHIDSNNFNLIN